MEVALGWATVTVSEVSGSSGVGCGEGGGGIIIVVAVVLVVGGGGLTIAVVGGALGLPAHCRLLTLLLTRTSMGQDTRHLSRDRSVSPTVARVSVTTWARQLKLLEGRKPGQWRTVPSVARLMRAAVGGDTIPCLMFHGS